MCVCQEKRKKKRKSEGEREEKSVAIWSKHTCVSPNVCVCECVDSSSSNLE